MGKVIFKLAVAAMAVFMAFAALRLYYLVYPQLDSDPHHGNYNAYFSDMQNRQIRYLNMEFQVRLSHKH